MSIQVIGRKGGAGSRLKFEAGFDYYKFDVYKVASNSVSELIQRGGVGFNEVVGIKNIDVNFAINVTVDAYIRNQDPFTYSCTSTETPQIVAQRAATEILNVDNCPISYTGSENKNQIFSQSAFVSGFWSAADDLIIRCIGGSGNKGTAPFIRHRMRGFFKVTAGAVGNLQSTGSGNYGTVSIRKLN